MATEFKYIVTDKGVKIKEYIGKDKEVVIPSEIDGMPVTSIGGCSFSSNKFVESVTIPDSVTEICLLAFSWCTCLKSITLPDSLTEIGSSAFEGCKHLKSKGYTVLCVAILSIISNNCSLSKFLPKITPSRL